jgi:Leucine-rich repeat (LRR) protein
MFYLHPQQQRFLEEEANFAIIVQSMQQEHGKLHLHWWNMASLPPLFRAALAIWCRLGRWRVESLHLFPEGWDERMFTGNPAQHRHPPALAFASTRSGVEALYIALSSGKVDMIGRKLQAKPLMSGISSKLSFSGCQLGAGVAGLGALGLRLAKSLTSLNLSGNSLGVSFNQETRSWQSCDDGINILCSALCESTTLTHLDLSANVIGTTGAALLGAALSQNGTLLSLDLSNNSLWCAGVKSIAEAIWGTRADKQSIGSAGSIGSDRQSIGSAGSIGSDRSAQKETVCRLAVLNLRRTKMGKEGALAILSPANNRSFTRQFSPQKEHEEQAASAERETSDERERLAERRLAERQQEKGAKMCIKAAMQAKRNGDPDEQLLQLRRAQELQPGNLKIRALLQKLAQRCEGVHDGGSGSGEGCGDGGAICCSSDGGSASGGFRSGSGDGSGASISGSGGSGGSKTSKDVTTLTPPACHQSTLTALNLGENNLAADMSWLPPAVFSDANQSLTALNLSQLGGAALSSQLGLSAGHQPTNTASYSRRDGGPHGGSSATVSGRCLRLGIEVLRSERLTSVDLSGNNLSDTDHADGLAVLALCWLVQTNQILVRLILERCELVPLASSDYYDTSPALPALRRAFAANKSLVHVNLSGNHLGDAGATAMGRVVEEKRKHASSVDRTEIESGPRICSLEYLDLCHNQISGTVRKQLHAEFTAHGVTLETSEIEDCLTGEGFDSAGDY